MDLALLTNYIRPELIVLVIVLYVIGMAIKNTDFVPDCYIPFILGFISIFICTIYILSASETPENYHQVFSMIFDIIIQGICNAAAAVYGHQLLKQGKEARDLKEEKKEKEGTK